MSRARRWPAVGLAVLLGLLAGCGGSDFPLLTASDPGTIQEALLVGVLEVDVERGCTWLASEEHRALAAWPHGTTVTEEPSGLRLPNDRVVHPGERVEGGGGFNPPAAAEELGVSGAVEAAQRCGSEGEEMAVIFGVE